MTPEEKIAAAAEMITSESARLGSPITLPDAVHMARQLYQLWSERVQIRNLPPGEVAQRFRERYDGHPDHDLPETGNG